jgi:hemerythrin-like domain-containing protein
MTGEQPLQNDHHDLDILLADACSEIDVGDLASTFDHLDLFWARLAVHIRAEHLHLFPVVIETFSSAGTAAMISGEFGSPEAAIRRLRDDHNFFMRRLGDAVRTLSEHASKFKTGSIPPDMLAGLKGDVDAIAIRLREHNRIEEEYIYPLAEKLLGEDQFANLYREIRKELANLPARFC